MRLSDAIALGRTLVSPWEGGSCTHNAPKDSGCALDMAVIAVKGVGDWHDATNIWGWLNKIDPERAQRVDSREYLWSVIQRFDGGVMIHKDITLDQLIDWVRSVEPAEEIPVDTTPVEEVEYASMT